MLNRRKVCYHYSSKVSMNSADAKKTVSKNNNKNKTAPGVSILRPLRGVDKCLEECLRSSFEFEYPNFELILSVCDINDPATPIAQKLIKEYPSVDARLQVGETIVGVNPKVNNMFLGYQNAKHDIIWILDSNVYMPKHSLDSAVNDLEQPGTGLVHHAPRGLFVKTLGSLLEAIYLNTSHARMYLAINSLFSLLQKLFKADVSCVTGKSMLFRRSDLKKKGGLSSFGTYLAEDNLIGLEIASLGLRHKLSCETASQLLGSISVYDYVERRVRWGRLRLYLVPISTLVEPFSESILCGLSGAWAMNKLFGFDFASTLLCHFLFWFLGDFIIYQSQKDGESFKPSNFYGHELFMSPLQFPFIWLLREITYLFVFLLAVFGNTVVWRGTTYRLKFGGTAETVDSTENDRIFKFVQSIKSLFTSIFVQSRKIE